MSKEINNRRYYSNANSLQNIKSNSSECVLFAWGTVRPDQAMPCILVSSLKQRYSIYAQLPSYGRILYTYMAVCCMMPGHVTLGLTRIKQHHPCSRTQANWEWLCFELEILNFTCNESCNGLNGFSQCVTGYFITHIGMPILQHIAEIPSDIYLFLESRSIVPPSKLYFACVFCNCKVRSSPRSYISTSPLHFSDYKFVTHL